MQHRVIPRQFALPKVGYYRPVLKCMTALNNCLSSTPIKSASQKSYRHCKYAYSMYMLHLMHKKNIIYERWIHTHSRLHSYSATVYSDVNTPMLQNRGLYHAIIIIVCWAMCLYTCLYQLDINTPIMVHILIFPTMALLYTGLFITGHDAMHGVICRNVKLNDGIGYVTMFLYACFSFKTMRDKHMSHHQHTCSIEQDPDYHGGNSNIYVWFFKFMTTYITIEQIIYLYIVGHLLNAPMINTVVYMAGAGLVSSFQLFYFGTFLPHKPETHINTRNQIISRTSVASSRLESFLKCFHFDCHMEHHNHPNIPWFDLWDTHEKDMGRKN